MNKIEIHLDNRENWDLNPSFLEKNNYKIIKKNLDVGDIQVLKNEEVQLIIERKTLDDLAASVSDGRYEEQKNRLYRLKNEGFKIVYLLEGDFETYDNRFSRVSRDTLKTIYLKFIMRDKIQVIKTSSLDETIDMIQNLLICIDKCKFEMKQNKNINLNQGDFKKENIQPSNCFAYQLQTIPGLSLSITSGISGHFKNGWMDLYEFLQTEENIKKKIKKLGSLELPEIKRKVGIKTAEKIIQYSFPQLI